MKLRNKGKMMKNKKAVKLKKNPVKQKKELAEMSLDDMFSVIEDDDDESDSEAFQTPVLNEEGSKRAKLKKGKKIKENWKDDDDDEDNDFEEDKELAGAGGLNRKEYLEKLKKTDPDFYAAIMQSSEVMDQYSSDEEDENDIDKEESSSGEEEEDPQRGGAVFQPPAKLEVDSDESDAEEEGLLKRGGHVVTASMITQWRKDLKGSKPTNTFIEVDQAFLAAIESLSNRGKEKAQTSKYEVVGPQIFNAVVRLCLQNMPSALTSLLNLKSPMDIPTQSKKWKKMKSFIKSYLSHLVMFTESVAEPSVAEVVLRHGVLPLLGYYAGLPGTCKLLLRRVIVLWATSEKRVRVLAFVCIFRLTRSLTGHLLEWVLKKLYLSYVRNSRFTSPSTWGLIDFMRLSLVELYALDQVLAYKHAFVYIRQMAFHLRNAIIVKNKERVQLVYNWQYVHCLHLWADLLAKTHPSPALQPIIYPLTQVALGTMKLQPIPSFYPLVFHICGILTELSRQTGTFIPLLPFLLEILDKAPLDKKHKKASIKHLEWMCMLRLSRAEMSESAFKDGVVYQVHDHIIDYLSTESASIGFPELVVPTILQLKSFIKKCKIQNYTKKIKQLLEKIKENQEFIESKRKEVSFGIADTKAVKDWEIAVRQMGTPLAAYHANWLKVHQKQQLRRISNHVAMGDYNLPVVKKHELLEKHKAKDKDDFMELFASDEDDLDDDTRFLLKNERAQVKKSKGDSKLSEDSDYNKTKNEEEDATNLENLDEEEDYEVGEKDVEVEPMRKKMKIAIKDDDGELMDINSPAEDVVREMNLSDFEADEWEEIDDYGEKSEESE
ncbi:LOW QUALITY PROTEIN: nucleolar complex protein 2 homolog [Panulirus ornatus]|uniref:LOW QUALITY PROTEIN: nucleolar complex protein 2 homolog n=1 Tax=Panulirus ornatus TaxID=150431 RepID=UPI003A8B2DF3